MSFPLAGMAASASGPVGLCQAGTFCPAGSFLPLPCTPGRRRVFLSAQVFWVGLGFLYICTLFPFARISRQSQACAVTVWFWCFLNDGLASAPCARFVLCNCRARSSIRSLWGWLLLHGGLHAPKPYGWSSGEHLSSRPLLSCREFFSISMSPR